MDMSQLKTQIMTMFMMKSGGNQDIFTIVYSMLLMNIVEALFRNAPQVLLWFQTISSSYFKPKRDAWMPLIDSSKKDKETLNSISMTRVFQGDSQEKPDKTDNLYVEKVDAVIDYLCSLDSAKHVKMDTRYTLNSTEEIVLTPLLKARVKETGATDEGSILEIVVYSSVLKVSEIRQWVDEVHSNYVFEKNNKLGNRIYYFNEVPVEPIVQCEIDTNGGPPKQTYRWENMPKMLLFNMNEFKTSKSFSNVYGNHVDELKERLDLFIQHPDWYMERGIPHSLGIMLHGVPGAGKTSTIKAIAKDTHRHIFNLSLRPYTSQRQLTNLFFNETVVVQGPDGNKQTLKIPLNRRVYVIEDIDCLTDVVMDRTMTGGKITKDGDAVTLSFLLNLLDGVLETPGRILVITSNFPDKLDRALVRPGRIDVTIDFQNASRAFILDMMNKFYSLSLTIQSIPAELDSVFTPAEVMESMCMHFKNEELAIAHMVQKKPKKLVALANMESAKGTSLEMLETFVNLALPTLPTSPQSVSLVAGSVTSVASVASVASLAEETDVAPPTIPKNEIFMNTPTVPKVPTASILPNAPVKTPNFQQPDYSWSLANFGDADFLPGGNMPGDLGVRSPIDLNSFK